MTIRTATIVHNYGLPVSVREDIDKLWADFELGNDYYYFKWDDSYDGDYPILAKFIKDGGFTGEVLVHNSW